MEGGATSTADWCHFRAVYHAERDAWNSKSHAERWAALNSGLSAAQTSMLNLSLDVSCTVVASLSKSVAHMLPVHHHFR